MLSDAAKYVLARETGVSPQCLVKELQPDYLRSECTAEEKARLRAALETPGDELTEWAASQLSEPGPASLECTETATVYAPPYPAKRACEAATLYADLILADPLERAAKLQRCGVSYETSSVCEAVTEDKPDEPQPEGPSSFTRQQFDDLGIAVEYLLYQSAQLFIDPSRVSEQTTGIVLSEFPLVAEAFDQHCAEPYWTVHTSNMPSYLPPTVLCGKAFLLTCTENHKCRRQLAEWLSPVQEAGAFTYTAVVDRRAVSGPALQEQRLRGVIERARENDYEAFISAKLSRMEVELESPVAAIQAGLDKAAPTESGR
jgi:hypothetical protein